MTEIRLKTDVLNLTFFFRFKPYLEWDPKAEALKLRPGEKKVIRKAFKYNNKAQNFLDKDIFSVMKIYCSVYFWLFTLERCLLLS